jgi:CHAT domain-containing protein
MPKLFLSLLLLVLLFLSLAQSHVSNRSLYDEADKIYGQAEQADLEAADDESKQEEANDKYSKAIVAFTKFITSASPGTNDSLLFSARLKAGFAAYYLDSAEIAKKNYLTAIALKQKLPAIADSLLFTPYLYTGGIYYLDNQFDSALFFYKKAAAINDSYSNPLQESQRLYNRLGVMYYETGNYRQARNYFEKAITLTDTSETSLLVNYRINIAALLVKLEEYEQAAIVYKQLLIYNIFQNEIFHNLGIISLHLRKYDEAINYLHKVNYTSDPKIIELYYHLAMGWSGLNKIDSSSLYIRKSLAENQRWNGSRKNISLGLIRKFQAEEMYRQQSYAEALNFYQQSIIDFTNDFNETNIYRNPDSFSGAYSYMNLFHSLTGKAAVLEKIYTQEKKLEDLKSALDCYRSAFKLTGYVEKTYTSDEARLFLNKIKYGVHNNPIRISLQLFELTGTQEYLEEAYLFDQRNKASLLSLNLMENEIRTQTPTDDTLLKREASLKTTITRLSLKASIAADSTGLANINTAIRDQEIELEKIREKMYAAPEWQKRKLTEQIPSVPVLQKRLDKKTALLSYHLSNDELLMLSITASSFSYHKTPVSKDFFDTLDSFKQVLQSASAESINNNNKFASPRLYQMLIGPAAAELSTVTRLVIIPDDELHYLPFEALKNESGNYLIESFAVQYHYSTALFDFNTSQKKSGPAIAFAPFSSNSYTDSTGSLLNLLPASKAEVNNINGKKFLDSAATKENFLNWSGKYAIIHLATHAAADNDDPSRSFIAFYPSSGDYKLYAGEIYNLHLNAADLAILSACQTGTGRLIKGEGLMSLSWAFAYAGCPNIITSLWKAEDKTTAFLTQRLHMYLKKGYSKDKALQSAKLDLLSSDEIAPRFKTPNYWAHLLFIGNYEPEQSSNKWRWIIGLILLTMLSLLIHKRIKKA